MCTKELIPIGRISLTVVASIISLIAIIFCIISSYRADWQTVLHTSNDHYHEHGIWKDCTINNFMNPSIETEETCEFKFLPDRQMKERCQQPRLYKDTPQLDEYSHCFHAWSITILILMMIALVSGIAGFSSLLCSFCRRISSIIALLFHLIAFLCSFGGVAAFFVQMHTKEYRSVFSADGKIYQQSTGNAFYFALVSSILFFVALLLNVFVTVLLFTTLKTPRGSFKPNENGPGEYNPPKHYTGTLTSPPRSSEKRNGAFTSAKDGIPFSIPTVSSSNV